MTREEIHCCCCYRSRRISSSQCTAANTHGSKHFSHIQSPENSSCTILNTFVRASQPPEWLSDFSPVHPVIFYPIHVSRKLRTSPKVGLHSLGDKSLMSFCLFHFIHIQHCDWTPQTMLVICSFFCPGDKHYIKQRRHNWFFLHVTQELTLILTDSERIVTFKHDTGDRHTAPSSSQCRNLI